MNKEKAADVLHDLLTDKDGYVSVKDALSISLGILTATLMAVPDFLRKEMFQDIVISFNDNMQGKNLKLYTEADIKPLRDTIDSLQMALNQKDK